MPLPYDPICTFCRIISGDVDHGNAFWEDDIALGLLDHRSLKPEPLLIPKGHYATMKHLSTDLIGPLFQRAAILNRAVEVAFGADGSFSGYNTNVSQSIDHFHLHVIPPQFGDKLVSGGKWVRQPVDDIDQHYARRDALGSAMRDLLVETGVA